MPEADDLLVVTVLDGVLTATINRPGRRNAYTYEVEHAWHRTLVKAAGDPSVRALVLTATGDTFCPGFDPDAIADAAAGDAVPDSARSPYPFHLATVIEKPVVCAVNGGCAGVGLALALTCDLRIAAEGAQFSTAFSRLGLPAERGTSWLLPRIIGHGRAADLLLTARAVGAAEARDLGLVHEVVEDAQLHARAAALAAQLAATVSPASTAAMKRQLYRDWDTSLADASTAADQLLRRLIAGPDLREGVTARAVGRPPVFTEPVRQEIH